MLQYIRKVNGKSTSLLLLLVLSADFALIVLHALNATPILDLYLFNVNAYGGYAKTYQSVKFFWVIILFAYVLRSTRYSGYGAWMLVFAYLLLEDAFQIHRTIGTHAAMSLHSYLPQSFIMHFRRLGLAIVALSLLAIVAWAYLKGPHAFKKISNDVSLFLVALVLFGVFVDIAAILTHGPVKLGLEIIEEGGEMVVVSLLLGYLFRLAIRNGNSDVFLHDLLGKRLKRGRT